MTPKSGQQHLRELVRSFDALRGMHEQLFAVLEGKIEAMRTANVPALQNASQDEYALLQSLREKENRRASLMQALARECGMSAKAARTATVSQITPLMPDIERELLLNAASRLQWIVARTAQANRIAATIARQVTHHMKFVFSAIRPARTAPVGYTLRGESFVANPAIMDVVG
jgi:hypothetical protein